jgi:hypothetical protein
MSDQDYIKSLVKEADLYRDQGLLAQAKGTYSKVLEFVRKNEKLRNQKKLRDAIGGKIKEIEERLSETSEETAAPDLSDNVQNLIRKLFSHSQDENAAAVEGAIALAKFGQHERAMAEFQRLFKDGIMPVVVAKNIIRCHLALSSPNEAIDQYEQWLSGDSLSKGELEQIRVLLQNTLERKGINVRLQGNDESALEGEKTGKKEGDVLDISSVGVRFAKGARKGRMVEFDVTFQSGNVISVVVSGNEKDLVESLEVGIPLADMQFYSPIAIFQGKGVISGKTKIGSGPKQGDYMLDIRIESG